MSIFHLCSPIGKPKNKDQKKNKVITMEMHPQPQLPFPGPLLPLSSLITFLN